MTATDLIFYFNFRSPYCYLASKTIWPVLDKYHVNLVWRPLAGWDGRSPPDRAKVKIPLVRQDLARWARRLGIPVNPPPASTDPTLAGLGSLLAEEQGLLRPYVVEMMRKEWAEGVDIGQRDAVLDVGAAIGLDRAALAVTLEDPRSAAILARNSELAFEQGVIGVPSFVVGDQIFWGNDRVDFLDDHLRELRLAKL